MLEADLYLDSVDLCRYWPDNAGISCESALDKIRAGQARLEDYAFLTRQQVQAFESVINAERYLPHVPLVTVPQPVKAEVIPLNMPDENSLVIVTGNNKLTLDVLVTVWSQSVTPVYLLAVDCLGSTVDMAVVFGEFRPERLQQALKESGLENKVKHRHIIVPGLTSSLASDFVRATNWEVQVGPICAVELPVFLGDRWVV